LIRHGETNYNHEQLFQGYAEVPLNDTGIRQAMLLAQRLADVPFDVIYASDLRRTVMTATVLSALTKAPIVYDENFRERDPGDLVHKNYTVGMDFFTDPTFQPPNGENLAVFDARIKDACTNLLALEGDCGRTVALVTHGMVCSSFYQHALQHSAEERAAMHWPNTALTVLDYDDGWHVETLADASHLEEGSPSSANATGA
jgi:broad specificity phosphatase PhoE